MQAEEVPAALAAEEPDQPAPVASADVSAVNKSIAKVEKDIKAVELKVVKIESSQTVIDGQLEQLKKGKVPKELADTFSFQIQRLHRAKNSFVAAVEALIADLSEKAERLHTKEEQLRAEKEQLRKEKERLQTKEEQLREKERQDRQIRILEMQSRVGNGAKPGMYGKASTRLAKSLGGGEGNGSYCGAYLTISLVPQCPQR